MDCVRCASPIPENRVRRRARFCTNECQRESDREAYKKANPRPPRTIPPGTVGAVAEYRVIADLLNQGYEVFHAASPACSCDMVILKNGFLSRIEVRTAYMISGKLNIPREGVQPGVILVGVLPDRIVYSSPLP